MPEADPPMADLPRTCDTRSHATIYYYTWVLQDKHGVSITIKAVTFLPGNGVGLEYPLPPGEGGDQYEKGGTREMKIGQKGVHHLKLVRGIYEEISPSTVRRQFTPCRRRLQYPERGVAYGYYPPSAPLGLIESSCGLRAQLIIFFLHRMLCDVRGLDWDK